MTIPIVNTLKNTRPHQPQAASANRAMDSRARAEMRDVLGAALARINRAAGSLPLRVPRQDGLMQKRPGMHFHFKPEFFIQLQGRTEFHFPHERFDLRAGEMCVIPPGVPHGEVVYPEADTGRPFRNLVAGFYSHALSLHFAHEASPKRPDIETIEFFDAPNLDALERIANGIVQACASLAPAREYVLKGHLFALLGCFRNLVETANDSVNSDVGKVFQMKWLVREQFANAELGVKSIAAQLQCSPDYISHLFHQETGERLTHYIQRIRIKGATLALETTPLHISEIAFASGFDDPAYFGRVFKQHCGVTPQEFRERLDEERRAEEKRPKTIYYDREDYSPGKPAGKVLKA